MDKQELKQFGSKQLDMSAPWYLFYRRIDTLFKYDREIKVKYDDAAKEIKIYVDNVIKADALTQIMPVERTFGEIVVNISIIPTNTKASKENLFRTAFEGNGIFSFATSVEGVYTNPITYVVFENEVAQYWADNLGDIHGQCSTLYQDIAADIFERQDGVCFCTDYPKY